MDLEVKHEHLSESSDCGNSNDDVEKFENKKLSMDSTKWDNIANDKPLAPKSTYKKKRQFCIECDKSFSKREYLSKHMRVDHSLELEKKRPGRFPLILKTPTCENDPRPYKCDKCEKEYIKSKHLSRHRRTHLQQYCNECNISTTNYAEHMLKVHNVEVPRPFECPECKKCFRTRANLSAHMRIHRAECRTYKCTVCLKSFFFSTDLRKHMRTHSQERSVICELCGDAFKTSDTLKSHMRRHTGERPYKCSQCPKAFSTSNSLDIHTRTHTGEKPFQCMFDGCGKRFMDPSTLQVHKRLHTNESPFQCHLCDRRTRQASNLRSHYKHFHRNRDITGRQIRLNSRIFSRYSQSEIGQHLREYGDLMVLLEKGLMEYNREENEKKSEITNALKLATTSMTKTTHSKNPTVQSKLAINTFTSKSQMHSTLAQATKQAALKKEDIKMELKMMCDCMRDEGIKQESPSNDNGSISIEKVFVDATDEISPSDIGNKVKKEKLSDSDGSEVFTNDHSKDDDDYEYEASASIVEINCNESKAHLETINNNETTDESDNGTTFVPVRQKKVKKYSERLAVSSRPKEHQDKIRRCITCNRSYHHILRHMVEAHSAIERPFECFICSKTYKRFEYLKYHMVTHGDKRDYVCHICGQEFFLNSDLRKHIFNRHQDNRPFKCDHPKCGKRFKSRRGLTVHERTHRNYKPFSCKICPAISFSTLGALKIHKRKHTGERPYQCPHCEKTFSDSSILRQHIRIHTGDKPYKCMLCDRRTAQAGNLKSHYRHFHKVIVKKVTMYRGDAHQSTLTDPTNMIPLTHGDN